jgi:hypothetical protein
MVTDLCQAEANRPYTIFLTARYACLNTNFRKRWMDLYNRAVETLNQNVNMDCDETHTIFDSTSSRVSGELDNLNQHFLGNNRNWVAVMTDYAQKEVLDRLTNGKAVRDKSCAPPRSQDPSLKLTGSTEPVAGPVAPTVSQPGVNGTAARNIASGNVHVFAGPRVATQALSNCSNRDKPACDNALLTCLRSCNSGGDVDGCNAGCQKELLSCKGC